MNNVKKPTVCLKDIPTPPVYVNHARMLLRQYKERDLPDTAKTHILFTELELIERIQWDLYVQAVKARKKLLDDNELADPHLGYYAKKALYERLGL